MSPGQNLPKKFDIQVSRVGRTIWASKKSEQLSSHFSFFLSVTKCARQPHGPFPSPINPRYCWVKVIVKFPAKNVANANAINLHCIIYRQNPPIDLQLILEVSNLKIWVWWTWFLVYFELEFSHLQISCSRHQTTKFPNSESPIFTTKFCLPYSLLDQK